MLALSYLLTVYAVETVVFGAILLVFGVEEIPSNLFDLPAKQNIYVRHTLSEVIVLTDQVFSYLERQ